MHDNIVTDEREEGEIVDDDDDLEDVSDSSICSPLHPGKSVTPTEHLRAISLSSISDEELESRRIKHGTRKSTHMQHRRYEALGVQLTKHPKNKTERRHRHTKHHRKRLHSVSDSEEDVPSRTIARQLKNAVHIQEDKEMCQKSLQSRLKGFMEPVMDGKPPSEDEEELLKLRKDALESKTPESSEKQESEKEPNAKDTVDDKELTELRLEALKSAVIQKHMLRKKRKGENDALPKSDSEVNKENAQDNINKEIQSPLEKAPKKPAHEENIPNVSTEEDLDIMRAMLLASMSTKIAKLPDPPPIINLPKPITRKINNPPANSMRKPMNVIRSVKNNYYTNHAVYKVQNKVNNNNVKVPTVEPLIINLNNDSDSDMDIDPPSEEEDKLSKKVTELLKQERAEVEAKTNKSEPKKAVEKTPTLDKSVLKLLPISQQMEYQKLKQQLMNAKKKPRIRRFSQKVGEIKRDTVVLKKCFKSKFTLNKVNLPINKTVRSKADNLLINKTVQSRADNSLINKPVQPKIDNSLINKTVQPRVDKKETILLLKTWNVLQDQMAGRYFKSNCVVCMFDSNDFYLMEVFFIAGIVVSI